MLDLAKFGQDSVLVEDINGLLPKEMLFNFVDCKLIAFC